MNYWLIKSDPDTYTFDDLKKDKSTVWDGVRNYAARNNMRAMKKGDLCLFYHSNHPDGIVGLAEVVKEAYQDPTTEDSAWSVVDVKFKKRFSKNISLETVKKTKALQEMQLIKLQRLSVQAVRVEEFDLICSMGE